MTFVSSSFNYKEKPSTAKWNYIWSNLDYLKTTLETGWNYIDPSDASYSSTTAIVLVGDWSGVIKKGTKIWYNQVSGGDEYGVVRSLSVSTNTTINLIANSDYEVANEGFDSISFSNIENPIGFPSAFNWTPTYGGFSSDPTSVLSRYSTVGNRIGLYVQMNNPGASNTNTFTMSAPVASQNITNMVWRAWINGYDNGLLSTTKDWASLSANSSTITFLKGNSSTGWTGSSNKKADFQFSYEF